MCCENREGVMKKSSVLSICLLVGISIIFIMFNPFKPYEKEVVTEVHWPGAPPVIPHDVESRRKCVGCHVVPGTPERLLTSHPERENCMQCHVPRVADTLFSRSE